MASEREDQQGLVRQVQGELPTPIFSGKQMADALKGYQELQAALDVAMKDQLIELKGKQFRKKGYWRAVSVAFGLTVKPVLEERVVVGVFGDGNDNFAYNVTYEAIAPNGRSATGDGSCSAAEKAGKFKCPHPENRNPNRSVHWPPENCPSYDPSYRFVRLPENATEHNVRSHAHSRAFNRAVSNLVGFGEVSAEEVDRNDVENKGDIVEGQVIKEGAPPKAQPKPPAQQQPPAQRRNEPPPPSDDDRPGGPGPTELPTDDQMRQGNARAQQQRQEARNPAPPPQQPRQQAAPPQRQQAAAPPPQRARGPVISDAQDRRYFAKAMAAGWDANDLRNALEEVWGYKRSDEMEKSKYNSIVAWVERGPKAAVGE